MLIIYIINEVINNYCFFQSPRVRHVTIELFAQKKALGMIEQIICEECVGFPIGRGAWAEVI